MRTADLATPTAIDDGQIWVRGLLPAGLDVVALQQYAPQLTLQWATPALTNIQREESHSGFAEIFLRQDAMRKMVLRTMQSVKAPNLVVGERRIDGYLQDWLFNTKEVIAPRGSDLYQPPGLGDLLYWDAEVLTPLLAAGKELYKNGQWSVAGVETLQAISVAMASFGYELIRYRHKGSGVDFLILAEPTTASMRHWGTYIMRLGPAHAFMFQIPRPLYEGSSFEFAAHLFESLQGRWLLIGGSHPDANRDGSADLISARTPRHLFNLVNQVVLRQANATPMQVVQCRSFTPQPGRLLAAADLLVAFRDGVRKPEDLSPLGRELLVRLEVEGLRTRFVDGNEGSSGYEVGLIPQARYLDATQNHGFAVLWLAPEARRGLRQQMDNRTQEAQFTALGLASRPGDLLAIVQELGSNSVTTVPADLRQAVLILQEYGDILPLATVIPRHADLHLWRLQELNTAQSFLMVADVQGHLLLVANLDPRQPELHIPLLVGSDRVEAVKRFLDGSAGLLEVMAGEKP